MRLVLVRVDDAVRLTRGLDKGMPVAEIHCAEKHSTEAEATTRLPHMADLIVDGGIPMPEAINTIRGYIDGEWGNEDHKPA